MNSIWESSVPFSYYDADKKPVGYAIDLCKDGDPICSRGRNPFAHSDYVSAGLTDQAANFVAGIV